MSKTTYVGIIKTDGEDIRTLVNAVDEADALKQVLEKFKTSLSYTEKDVTIHPFFGNDKN